MGGNQESRDSEGKGRVFLEGQGGPGSDVTVLGTGRGGWSGLKEQAAEAEGVATGEEVEAAGAGRSFKGMLG